jgi:hypothetical protein
MAQSTLSLTGQGISDEGLTNLTGNQVLSGLDFVLSLSGELEDLGVCSALEAPITIVKLSMVIEQLLKHSANVRAKISHEMTTEITRIIF